MSSYKTKYQPIVRVGREILDCHIYGESCNGVDLDMMLCQACTRPFCLECESDYSAELCKPCAKEEEDQDE